MPTIHSHTHATIPGVSLNATNETDGRSGVLGSLLRIPMPSIGELGHSPSANTASAARRQIEPAPDFNATGIPGTHGTATPQSTLRSGVRHCDQRLSSHGDIITWSSSSHEPAMRTPRSARSTSTANTYSSISTPRTSTSSQQSRRHGHATTEGAAGTPSGRLNSKVSLQGFNSGARRVARASSLSTSASQGLAADGLLISRNWSSSRRPVRIGAPCVPPFATNAAPAGATSRPASAAAASPGYKVLHMKHTPSPQAAQGWYHPLLHRNVL